MYAYGIYCHIFGCERIHVPIPAPLAVSAHRPRSATTGSSCLPTEHSVLGYETIPLVSA